MVSFISCMVNRFFIISLVLFFLSISPVLSIGISPAIKAVTFEPGKEVNITFYVLDATEGVIYDINMIGGTLIPYSSVNKASVQGNSDFILTIRFPQTMEKPGDHTVSVSVKERPSETSFISTVVEVGSVIKTFVPYPGIYGDLSLSVPDGNIDEKIPVELHIINRGDNPLEISSVFVDFISPDGKVSKVMNFTPANVAVSGERYFRKYLEASNMMPGNYIARGRVTYSNIDNEVNKSFRIGSLFVNITNFSRVITGKGIQKFYVSLENRWNSPISGVYVDVEVSNDLGEKYSFRTPSADLDPWEEKTIESYFDVQNLKGSYNVLLNATYNGKSTDIRGVMVVQEEDNTLMIYGISAAIALVFFIVFYAIILHFIRGKKRK